MFHSEERGRQMIIQIRIDYRLIHGQVALIWLRELDANGILIANDEAANNDTIKMTLKMACPIGKKILIKTVEDAKKVINSPQAKDMRIFGFTKNIADALELAKSCGDNILEINLASASIHDHDLNDKILLTPKRFTRLDAKELEAAKELIEIMGDRFVSQLVPTSTKYTVKEII
jgi:PTS system mannose-specific IIB component